MRDLEHIQSFATEDMSAFSEIRDRSRSRSRGTDDSPQYEISEMKVEHIIEMVAGLLTKITTTNDQQHEHLHRQPSSLDSAIHLNPQTSSVVAFHGKNVPSITILSYLTRINKYCPTSYEVFLSLLVYFDRMTERVNAGPMQSLREANAQSIEKNKSRRDSDDSSASADSDEMEGVVNTSSSGGQTATPPASGGMEKPIQPGVPGTPHSKPQQPESPSDAPIIDPYNLSHFFVVDSFNIHRLVIAGVTCASKFFSDIFYTNSRYAKVSKSSLIDKVLQGTNFASRLADCLFPNLITWNCNSSYSTTSDSRCLSKRLKPTVRCSLSSTLVRSLPSRKPQKPCKLDHLARAQRTALRLFVLLNEQCIGPNIRLYICLVRRSMLYTHVMR